MPQNLKAASLGSERILAMLNCLTGSFSAVAGLRSLFADPSTLGDFFPSNPLIYVVGGLLTVATGIANWRGSRIGIWGTSVFIVASLLNGWIGAGNADLANWRFWTLNSYCVVAVVLLLMIVISRRRSSGASSPIR